MKAEIIETTGGTKNLVVTIPMNDPRPSASGKTLVVASSGGNQETDVKVKGETVKIGLNAFIRKSA